MPALLRKALSAIVRFASLLLARLEEHEEDDRIRYHTPRLWKFVNAHGPQQTIGPRPMTHDEAVRFCREIIGYGYVQTDFAGSIVFFAGPKGNG